MNGNPRVLFLARRIALWAAAGGTIYALSAVRYSLGYVSSLGLPSFQSHAEQWRGTLDFSPAVFATLLYSAVALPAFLPPRLAQRFYLILLALTSVLWVPYVWHLVQGVRAAGVHLNARSTLRLQYLPVLFQIGLWLVYVGVRPAPTFFKVLILAFLIAFYATNIAAPGSVGPGF